MMDGVRIPSVDQMRLAEDQPLSLEQPESSIVALKRLVDIRAVGPLAIGVESDQDFVRQRLEGPFDDCLEMAQRQMNGGRVSIAAVERDAIVISGSALQPRFDHALRMG